MFTYEFSCPTHGRFEAMCQMGVQAVTCPHCQIMCGKVPSAPAFILKGDGWTKKEKS